MNVSRKLVYNKKGIFNLSDYNVTFVNNDNLSSEDFNNIDFHPNKKGHEKIYRNFIKEYENK